MAEAAVSFLADNLRQLIIQGADRLKPVEDEVRDIEEQLHELEAIIKDLQAMNSSDKHLEQIISEKIQPLIYDAEASINTYISIVSERAKKGIVRRPFYFAKQHESAQKLRTLRTGQVEEEPLPEITVQSHVPRPAEQVEEELLPEATDQIHVPPPAGQVKEELFAETTDQTHVPRPAGQVEEEPLPEITDQIHFPPPAGQVDEELLPETTDQTHVPRPAGQVEEEPSPETTDQTHVTHPAAQEEDELLPEITDQIHFPHPAGQVEEELLPETTDQTHVPHPAAQEEDELLPEITDKIHFPHPAGQVEEGPLPKITDQSHVPSQLWRFVYYLLLFPVNFEIPSRRLFVLWAAEGLIRPIALKEKNSGRYRKEDNDEWDEHCARDYLNELIDQGLVLVTKKKLNGKVQACKLRDSIREQWLGKAKETRFFQSTEGVNRLVDHSTGTNADSFIRIHGNASINHLVPERGNVISFLSFDTKEGSKPGEDIGDFLDKCVLAGRFIWLRVLDLERVFRPKLPKTLGKLIRLKYLGLRWTYLEKLPDFVNKLLELQVLDVKHTYISVLPKSIWTMQDLRHLYLSEVYRTRFPDWPSGRKRGCLTRLRTLWGAFVDEDTCVKDGLDTLLDIRKLGLSCCSSTSKSSDMSEQLIAVDRWIAKLKFLECLRLKSRHGDGRAADLHLSSLEGNKSLSTVYLLGKLNAFVVCKFPESLTDVTLSWSWLNMDPMEVLGELPRLQILRLLAQSMVHTMMHCYRQSFSVLKVLYIWKLENLAVWRVDEGAMPCLEEVEIRSCLNLEGLPDELQHVSTLKKCRLTDMPERFVDQTMVTQPWLRAKIELGHQDN